MAYPALVMPECPQTLINVIMSSANLVSRGLLLTLYTVSNMLNVEDTDSPDPHLTR